MNNNELITALREGRKVHPIKWHGSLFAPNGRACALGAIAEGLNIPHEGRRDVEIYGDLEQRFSKNVIDQIWVINDNCYTWENGWESDPDEVVIEYLSSLTDEHLRW